MSCNLPTVRHHQFNDPDDVWYQETPLSRSYVYPTDAEHLDSEISPLMARLAAPLSRFTPKHLILLQVKTETTYLNFCPTC